MNHLSKEKINKYVRLFELYLKSRTGVLTSEENAELIAEAATRLYGDKTTSSIEDLSYDIYSGKLHRYD